MASLLLKIQVMTSSNINERVAQRAYEIFVASGHQHGRCTDNWLRAENEIREQEQRVPEDHRPLEPQASARRRRGSRR